MQEKNKLVEEALLQMKNVEEAIAENAKGILQSTMKEEISQLVKESLMEQPEDDLELPEPTDDEESDDEESDYDNSEDEESDDEDLDYEGSDDEEDITFSDDEEFGSEDDMEFSDDEEVMDISNVSDEELWDVWVKMNPDDGFQIKSDGDYLHLSDEETGKEYIAKSQSMSESNKERMKKTVKSIFDESEVDEDIVYEIHFDDSDEEIKENPLLGRLAASAVGSYIGNKMSDSSEVDEEIYEYSDMDEEDTYEYSDMDEEDTYEYSDMDEEDTYEYSNMDEGLYESKKKVESSPKKSFKSPGRVGKVKKVEFKSNTEGGFDEEKKEGPKREGKTGSASKAVKYSGENIEKGKNKIVGKKMETKEAARSYAFGSEEGRGLRKGVTPNRNLNFESLNNEVKMLREKNEEYRKALNIFREKLNEVAIFNSNLAYATRLFTEHSTTKKEKLNILRRFDNAETLKESKALYRTLKDELSKTNNSTISESIENKITKTVSTGSATTLIESKTYENPQFLRMKDLMSKLG